MFAVVNSLLNRRLYLVCILFLPLFCNAQKINGPIVLNGPQFIIPATEFYIAGVVDERPERNAVAWLLPASASQTTPVYTVDLKEGCVAGIKQFIDKSLPLDKSLRPVIIHIKTFRVDELLQKDGGIADKLSIHFSFNLKKETGEVHLVDYRGGLNYARGQGQQMDIAAVMSNGLRASLIYFNSWMDKQADGNIKLAKGVKLIFDNYTEQPEGDTIYYSSKRPLTWADFQQKPPNSKYEAEVFPSFGYDEKVDIIKGIVNVHLSLKAYLPKSACWVKSEARNNYSLNHEQRHFDIVKLIAEHFKQALLKEKFTVDNYDGPINVQFLDSFTEMNQLQEKYDGDTAHGTNSRAQSEWNERIDKELSLVVSIK